MSTPDFEKEAAAAQSFLIASAIIALVLVCGGIWYVVMTYF